MTEASLFIRNIASEMESRHFGNTGSEYLTEAYISEAFADCERIDEGFIDIVKMIGRGISYPIEKVKNFWKHDRELVAEVAKAEKAFPRETIAAVYAADFADTNIVEDLWDMLCMLKDVVLFRYQHVPWRTAISAAALALYYFSPYNLTLGTAIVKWLESGGGAFTGNLFGGEGNADAGAEAIAKTTGGEVPGETVVDVTGKGSTNGTNLPTNNPDVKIGGDGSAHEFIGEEYAESDGVSHIGETMQMDDGTVCKYVDETTDVNPYNDKIRYTVPGIDTNGDGRADIWYHPTDACMKDDAEKYVAPATNESVSIAAGAAATAAGAGILYYHAHKAQIIAGMKVAEPYLNHLDELLIVFLLWKWFKKDLKDYRKWLATKEIVKDRVARKM